MIHEHTPSSPAGGIFKRKILILTFLLVTCLLTDMIYSGDAVVSASAHPIRPANLPAGACDFSAQTGNPEKWRLVLMGQQIIGYYREHKKPLDDNLLAFHNEWHLQFDSKSMGPIPINKTTQCILSPNHGVRTFNIHQKSVGIMINGIVKDSVLNLIINCKGETRRRAIPLTAPLFLTDFLYFEVKSDDPPEFDAYVFNDFTYSVEKASIHIQTLDNGHSKITMRSRTGSCENILDQNYNLISGSESAAFGFIDCCQKHAMNLNIKPHFINDQILNKGIPFNGQARILIEIDSGFNNYFSTRFPSRQRIQQTDSLLRVTLQKEDVHKLTQVPLSTRVHKDSPHYDTNTARILSDLVNLIQKKSKDTPSLVKNLNDTVFRYIKRKKRSQVLPLENILKEKTGDCKAHAVLFHALGLKLGLDVRFCNGLAATEPEVFTPHMWNVIYFDDVRIETDATLNQTTVDASHMIFKEDPSFEECMIGSHKILYYLKNQTLKVVNYHSQA